MEAPAPEPVVQEPAPEPVVEEPAPAPIVNEPAAEEPLAPPEAPVIPAQEPAAPTDSPVPPADVPAEEPVVWVNTDAFQINEGVNAFSLQPAGAQTISLGYAVTTPRSSTTVYAQLSGAGEGWSITSPNLGDADASETSAAWTQTASLDPGTSIVLPIVITAPANVIADKTVSLLAWSTASGPNGSETGVANTGIPIASFTVVAPPPIVNTDSVQLVGEATRTIAPGQETAVSFNYTVTTPRQGTTVHGALVDEAGNTPAGWTLAPVGVVSDATALVPGSSFETSFTVVGPDVVETPQTVSLVVWSEASTNAGTEAGVARQAIATTAVSATPAEPSITCQPGAGTSMTCALNADRMDVTGGTLTISGAPGWSFDVNGTAVSQSTDLTTLSGDGALPESLTISPVFADGCPDPAQQYSATIVVSYTYTEVPAANAEADVALRLPAPVAVAPSVSMQPVDFGTLTWDGTSWGSADAVSTIRVARDGCGSMGAYDVQIEIIGAVPGAEPTLVSASTSSPGIAVPLTGGDINAAPVTVAHASSDFTGAGEIALSFNMTPDDDVPVGTQRMEIRVTTTNAP